MASQASIDVVQKAYIAYYGRPADYAGMTYWGDQLDKKDGDLGAIIQQFGNSEESKVLYSGTDYGAQIKKMYQQLFGRDPDADGLDFYVGKLNAGEYTLQTIALNILNGSTGDDLVGINNKLAVAKDFTMSLHESGSDHSYMGSDDAQVVRDMLGQVGPATDASGFVQSMDAVISGIHDDAWVKYGENVDSLAAGSGSVFAGNDYYADQFARSYDVLVSSLDGGLAVKKSVVVGDANYQSTEAMAVTTDGGVVIAGYQWQSGVSGYDSFITKLNANLDVVGTVKIGTPGVNDWINHVAVRPDGKIVAVGYEYTVSDAKDAYIAILNSDMSVFAQRRVDNALVQNSSEEFHEVTVLGDNSMVVNAGNGTLLKFDANLNLVKTVDFDKRLGDLQAMADGTLMARYDGYLAQLDSSLNVLKVWDANFDFSDLEAMGGGIVLSGGGSNESVVTVGFVNGDLVTSDVEYITNRSGYTFSTDDVVVLGENVLVHNDYSDYLLSLDPSVDVQPDLSSDLRVQERDANTYLFTELAKTSYAYPKMSPVDWKAGDVSIVGSLSFTTISADGTFQEVARGTLDA